MRRIHTLAIATATSLAMLFLAAAFATAAGAKEGAATEKVTLNFWNEWSSDPGLSMTKYLVNEFNKTHPGVTVVDRPIENEQFFTALRTGFTGDNPPEVFQTESNDQLFQFVRVGKVNDISDYWPKIKDRFIAGSETGVEYDGKFYGVPVGGTIDTEIFYNEALLEQNGIDPASLKTWDDYLAAFQKLKSAGVIPIAYGDKFGWPGSQWFYMFLIREVGANFALNLCARNPGYSWTDPRVVAAAQMYADLNTKGYFSAGKASDDFAAAEALFFGGKAAFFQAGSWVIGDYKSSAPPGFKLGMSAFPMVTGGKGNPSDILYDGDELSISAHGASNPATRKAALEFIDWFTQLPQAKYDVQQTQGVSAVSGAITADNADPLLLKVVVPQLDNATGAMPFLEHILPPSVGEDKIWMGSVGILTGQLTPQTWMQSVQDEAMKQTPVYARSPSSK